MSVANVIGFVRMRGRCCQNSVNPLPDPSLQPQKYILLTILLTLLALIHDFRLAVVFNAKRPLRITLSGRLSYIYVSLVR